MHICTEIGTPVRFWETDSVVGRIIGYPEECESEKSDVPKRFHSNTSFEQVVFVSTPYGTILRTGILWLRKPEDSDLERLSAFESLSQIKLQGKPLYGGYNIDPSAVESPIQESDADLELVLGCA